MAPERLCFFDLLPRRTSLAKSPATLAFDLVSLAFASPNQALGRSETGSQRDQGSCRGRKTGPGPGGPDSAQGRGADWRDFPGHHRGDRERPWSGKDGQPAPGSGVEVWFSEYEAFALLNGLRLRMALLCLPGPPSAPKNGRLVGCTTGRSRGGLLTRSDA
jgi:hypothetical protein